MKLLIRRVGNSLGVIIPRKALDLWGLGEGDHLELTALAFRLGDQVTVDLGIGLLKRFHWLDQLVQRDEKGVAF